MTYITLVHFFHSCSSFRISAQHALGPLLQAPQVTTAPLWIPQRYRSEKQALMLTGYWREKKTKSVWSSLSSKAFGIANTETSW